jgi:hypothetical protein
LLRFYVTPQTDAEALTSSPIPLIIRRRLIIYISAAISKMPVSLDFTSLSMEEIQKFGEPAEEFKPVRIQHHLLHKKMV